MSFAIENKLMDSTGNSLAKTTYCPGSLDLRPVQDRIVLNMKNMTSWNSAAKLVERGR